MNSTKTFDTNKYGQILRRILTRTPGHGLALAIITGMLTSAIGQTTFTKITTSPIVTDGGISWACVWGDYDNDGYLDLFVSNGDYNGGNKNFLYHNNGDGTFTRIVSGSIVNDISTFRGASWVDFDNDGYLDLSVVCHNSKNFLYRNNGNGTFTKLTSGPIVTDITRASIGGSWADYNRDGYLDFFVANAGTVPNFLYRNKGAGAYIKITTGRMVTDPAMGESGAWADYDNDGYPDLFVTNFRNIQNFFYHNMGDGTFERKLNPTFGSIVSDIGNSHGCAWGDYDNDGYPDTFVSNETGTNNFLYHNNSGQSFTLVKDNGITSAMGNSTGCAWGDYDNDGYLDLFVANLYQPNFLFHNNGDGTFTRVTTGSIATDGGPGIPSIGCSWGDYDNDGFLDLVVTNGGGPTVASVNNFLYHNNGNSNAWLKIKCVGLVSNWSAVGAKVRVKASIGGKTFWQLREVTVGDGFASGSPLETHFGLGNATNIELVRIEWPSGSVTEIPNVAPQQFLSITEPPRFYDLAIVKSSPEGDPIPGGALTFKLWPVNRRPFDFEYSTNLKDWSLLIPNFAFGTGITNTLLVPINPTTGDFPALADNINSQALFLRANVKPVKLP